MFSIQLMCKIFSVSRAGFYAWKKRPESRRKKDDGRLLMLIKTSFQSSRDTYGYRRIHHDLREQNVNCGKHRVARIMHENGIRPKTKRKFRAVEGWLYLATVMDLYSRRIVGWAMSHRLLDTLVTDALKMALFRRKIRANVFIMSDTSHVMRQKNWY